MDTAYTQDGDQVIIHHGESSNTTLRICKMKPLDACPLVRLYRLHNEGVVGAESSVMFTKHDVRCRHTGSMGSPKPSPRRTSRGSGYTRYMREITLAFLWLTVTLILLLVCSPSALAAPEDSAPPEEPAVAPALPTAPDPLRVGVLGNPPFQISRPDEPLAGISVDLWRTIAEELSLDYTFVPLSNTEQGIEHVVSGEFDVLIGPVSITSERAERVSFTQPYWDANLAILAKAGSSSMWLRVRPFLSRVFLVGVSVLLLVLAVVGALLWALERTSNEEFPQQVLPGIGAGMWLAIVTMTTVGYGDKAPITPAGRVVTGAWMVIAMITSSSLTAGIATALTLNQLEDATISTAADLDGRPVAVVEGSTGEAFARRNHARIIEVDSIEAAA